MEARNRAFQQLKPICVKLSESALKLMGKTGNTKDIIADLQQLQKALRVTSTQQKDAIDNKFAEYIFFPLSTVLKQLEKIPLQGRELTFDCIFILLQAAWSRKIAPELGMQLLILYTFVTDQNGAKKSSSEELQAVLFKSMAIVLSALGADPAGREALMSAKTVPHLGKAASVILDGVLDGPAEDVQLSAVAALDAFVRAVPDRDALGTSFLPGIMSFLAKVLTFKGAKTSSKVLAAALNVLTYLLPLLFRDGFTKTLPEGGGDSKESRGLSQTWLKATAPQVKMALANIIKLQQHDRQNVRLALGKLCSTLLQDCSTSLADSVSMLLEASLTLATQEETLEAEFRHLITTSTALAETLQSSLHYWIMSLPRMMDSADETKKQRRIHQITLSFRLLTEQGLDMSMINRDLASNMRDSVAGAIKDPQGNKTIAIFETTAPISLDLVRDSSSQVDGFKPIIAMRKSQMDTVKDLAALARQISTNDTSLVTAQDLISSIYNYSGDLQLSSFWLTLNMVRNALISDSNVDAFLIFADETLDIKKDLLEQLYDFSISILSDTSLATETDWRLQALALEAVALQATQQGKGFRTELIDALYPVLHYMGSTIPALQNHAITALNIIARECGYRDSGSLIVANVDYLVNAVALRLNTFDISPQAPQVLLMMVKLAGPRLLPYLDDTVDSIFVALESFHGYPKLVDLLFSVLKVIVEEGAKAEQLAITDGGGAKVHRKNATKATSIEDVVKMIREVRVRYSKSLEEPVEDEKFPKEPWGNDKKDNDNEDQVASTKDEDDKPPAPRTYSLLLNISKLTQHYLTTSSSELRTSLLNLLSVSFPVLAKHENSFLPLIHTLWPVLLPRLDDSEPYVVAGSLRIIGLMCEYAGDFMSGRIEEAWPQIRKLHHLRTGRAGRPSSRTQRAITYSKAADITSIVTVGRKKEVEQPVQQQHYVDAPSRIIWDALVDMMVEIVTYTATNDVLFDEVVEMLAPVITSRTDVRNALESRNADAVWLALFRLHSAACGKTEILEQSVEDVVQLMMPLARSAYQWAPLR